jgi:pimeloyl-ACP methyl ester carboxylesterase
MIVPDHMGFGKSDVPADKPYTLAQHVDNLTKLLLELDLSDITLVGHDWGGPIMFGFAVNYPDRVKRLVIMNTGIGVYPEGTKTWVSDMIEKGIYEEIMGKYKNTTPQNIAGATIVIAIIVLSTLYGITTLFPGADCINGYDGGAPVVSIEGVAGARIRGVIYGWIDKITEINRKYATPRIKMSRGSGSHSCLPRLD